MHFRMSKNWGKSGEFEDQIQKESTFSVDNKCPDSLCYIKQPRDTQYLKQS